MPKRFTIGLDLDNTIACYDEILHSISKKRGWINETKKNKQLIRDAIRNLEHGEEKWQRLQAEIYGPRMPQAKLYGGVREFLHRCVEHKVPVYIISHKTQFSHYQLAKIDLRKTALQWLRNQNLLTPKVTGLSVNRVYFESTRENKIGRIKQLNCSHFIDDLEEVFLSRSFPVGIKKFHFKPDQPPNNHSLLPSYKNWHEITKVIFKENDQ